MNIYCKHTSQLNSSAVISGVGTDVGCLVGVETLVSVDSDVGDVVGEDSSTVSDGDIEGT